MAPGPQIISAPPAPALQHCFCVTVRRFNCISDYIERLPARETTCLQFLRETTSMSLIMHACLQIEYLHLFWMHACILDYLLTTVPYPILMPAILNGCLLVSLNAWLPSCQFESLPACLPASLNVCLPASLNVCLPASLYRYVCLPACLNVCLSASFNVCLPACQF